MKLFRRVSCPKVLLWLSNLTLLGCACALIVAGGVLYVDQRKLLVSKLLGVTNEFLAESPKPLFYWIAIGCAGCGLIGLFAAILGCWANCWTNYCTLTLVSGVLCGFNGRTMGDFITAVGEWSSIGTVRLS